jgi:hypothetical protein
LRNDAIAWIFVHINGILNTLIGKNTYIKGETQITN